MSGETGEKESGWTVDTLKVLLEQVMTERDQRYDQRFEAQQGALKDALAAADRAVAKQETATDRRFELANELRQSLDEAAAKAITRSEADAKFSALNDRLTLLQSQADKTAGFPERLTALSEGMVKMAARLDTMAGERTGVSNAWGYVVGAIGLAAAIIGIILAFNS